MTQVALNGMFPSYANHISNMTHQFSKIYSVKETLLPFKECLIYINFSEIYLCKYYREAQSAHFGGAKPQVTLHTVVWYFETETGDIKVNSFCTFSESLRHDPAAISAHLIPLIRLITNTLPHLESAHICSDGPSTQYQNKTMFYLAGSMLPKLFEVGYLSWHYFESGHEKGAVDGIGGYLKRTADKLVAQGVDIANFQLLILHLKEACPGIVIETVSKDQIKEI